MNTSSTLRYPCRPNSLTLNHHLPHTLSHPRSHSSSRYTHTLHGSNADFGYKGRVTTIIKSNISLRLTNCIYTGICYTNYCSNYIFITYQDVSAVLSIVHQSFAVQCHLCIRSRELHTYPLPYASPRDQYHISSSKILAA